MSFLMRSTCLISLLIILNVLQSRSQMSPKIVGGDYVKIQNHPHSVFLDCKCDRRKRWSCGASVLNHRVLLTAAHCLVGCSLHLRDTAINAFAGSEDYETKYSVVRSVAQTTVHPGYKENTVVNDIGLTKLKTVLPLNSNIKKVIIPNPYPSERNGIVAGWGISDEPMQWQDSKLRFLAQQIQPSETCSLIRGLRPGMICARNIMSHRSFPSHGDSGSGLVTSKGEQLGLVSFRDTKYKYLTVYTNVTYYLDWIKISAKKMICNY